MEAERPRLSYIVLFCADLEAALAFYRDRIGLRADPYSGGFVLLDAGGIRLGLHAGSAERRTSGLNLHFDVADLEAAVAQLTTRGVRFEGPPREEPWGARVVRTTDPDGNSVELVQWLRRA